MRRFALLLAMVVVAGPAYGQKVLPEFLIQSVPGPIDLRYVDLSTFR